MAEKHNSPEGNYPRIAVSGALGAVLGASFGGPVGAAVGAAIAAWLGHTWPWGR